MNIKHDGYVASHSISHQMFIDRQRYKFVVEKLLEWDNFTPGPWKAAGMNDLIALARHALACEGQP